MEDDKPSEERPWDPLVALPNAYLTRSARRSVAIKLGPPFAYSLSGAAILSLVALYPLLSAYPLHAAQTWDVVLALLSAADAYSALATSRRYGSSTGSRFGLAWTLFAGGTVSVFGSQVVTASYELFPGAPQVPPLSQLLVLAAFAFIISGMVIYVSFFSTATGMRAKALSGVVVFVIAVAMAATLEGPVMASSYDTAGKALEIAFPLLSIVLFYMVALGLITFLHGKVGRAWALMAAAMVLGTSGAFAASIYAAGPLSYAPVANVLFGSAYALGALAFYVHRVEL